MPASVQIPGKAVGEGDDVRAPVVALLQALNLLPDAQDLNDAGSPKAAITGPPQSVAVIEAGATAASKWWAAGFGASAIAAWARVYTWWGGQPHGIQAVALGGAFVVTAAAVASIAYLFAADIRGRAAATVATINAREALAEAMVEATRDSSASPHNSDHVATIALNPPLMVKNFEVRGEDEGGWVAIGAQSTPGGLKFLVVKDGEEAIVDARKIGFVG